MAEFAKGLKQRLSTVAGWVHHDQWRWSRKAPWSVDIVPDVLRWAAENLERGRPAVKTGDSKLGKLKLARLLQETRRIRATADEAETRLAKVRGTLLDAEAVTSEWSAIGVIVRNALENLPAQIVPLALTNGLPNESAPRLHAEVEQLISRVLRHLSNEGTRQDQQTEPGILRESESTAEVLAE